jgi:hypothetical protein
MGSGIPAMGSGVPGSAGGTEYFFSLLFFFPGRANASSKEQYPLDIPLTRSKFFLSKFMTSHVKGWIQYFGFL